jgi:glyceraldehyde 3-phosphate dehydrogenase
MTRVGINGFGRIGRQVLKAALEKFRDDFQVVAVNDLMDADTNAHLFKYDSNYGRFDGEVAVVDGGLMIDGQHVMVFAERDPAALPWGDLGVEIVVESTGVFRDRAGAAKHLEAGARKVLISANTTSSLTPRAPPTAWHRRPRSFTITLGSCGP